MWRGIRTNIRRKNRGEGVIPMKTQWWGAKRSLEE
jgi:hypothetical protein